MGFFLHLMLFFPLLAYSQREVSPAVFQANVRPALSGIISDFYQMLSQFPDFPQGIEELTLKLSRTGEMKANLLAECPGVISKKCLSTLRSIQSTLSDVNADTDSVLARLRIRQSLHIDSIAGLRILGDFATELDLLRGEVNNDLLLIQGEVPHQKKSYPIVRKMDELLDRAQLAVVEFVPYLYKGEFRAFCSNFIFPIQKEVSKVRNYEFMNRNVGYFNFSLNLFKQSLTKRNKKTPEGMAGYLEAIHNRWNSAMRFYY